MTQNSWLQCFSQAEQPQPGVTADAAPEDEKKRAEEFRALVQGPYRKEYDRQVQTIVRERLKHCAASEQILKALAPALRRAFGVEAETLSVETAKKLAELDPGGKLPQTPEQREQAMREGYARVKKQFARVQQMDPQAQLSRELDNPAFMRLLRHGVDAASAYALTHLRELTGSAMAYGARRAREELTAAMQAGYLRPRESGMEAAAGSSFVESPEHWSKKTREELKTRARRGEKVRL